MTLMEKIIELDLDDVVAGKRDPDSEERLLLTALAEYYLTHIDSSNMGEIIDEINSNSDLEIEDEEFDIEDFSESEDDDEDELPEDEESEEDDLDAEEEEDDE